MADDGWPSNTSSGMHASRYKGVREISVALHRTLLMDHPWGREGSKFEGTERPARWISDIYWTAGSGLNEIQKLEASRYSCPFYYVCRMNNPFWMSFDRFRQTNAMFNVFGKHFQELFAPVPLQKPEAPTRELFHDQLSTVRQLDSFDTMNVRIATVTSIGRRLATTSTRFLAMVPEETMEDDIIAVFHGCNFPVILRQASISDSTSHARGSYEYIGEAYVDGIMEGEVADALDSGELVEERITII